MESDLVNSIDPRRADNCAPSGMTPIPGEEQAVGIFNAGKDIVYYYKLYFAKQAYAKYNL